LTSRIVQKFLKKVFDRFPESVSTHAAAIPITPSNRLITRITPSALHVPPTPLTVCSPFLRRLAFPSRGVTLSRVSTTTQSEARASTPAGGGQQGHPVFVTTHWSVVAAAGHGDTPGAQATLEKLCRSYWYPLYAFVRRCGRSPEDAQDSTQAFFAELLEHNWVADEDQSKGRFRTLLLVAMRRFLAKEWHKARALNRGGRIRLVPLELDAAETRYSLEPADTRTPEQVFERHWAATLLASVLGRLREEHEREGKKEYFETLEHCLVRDREKQPYAALGAKLGVSEGAVKMAVCRLRERYRECLKEEIGHTVAAASEVEAELHHLFRVLVRG